MDFDLFFVSSYFSFSSLPPFHLPLLPLSPSLFLSFSLSSSPFVFLKQDFTIDSWLGI